MAIGIIGLGAAMVVMGIGAVIAPQTLIKESKRNHVRRLRELEEGAPEAYFEEKRELEAYQPRFDLSHKIIGILGGVAMVLGAAAVLQGFYS